MFSNINMYLKHITQMYRQHFTSFFRLYGNPKSTFPDRFQRRCFGSNVSDSSLASDYQLQYRPGDKLSGFVVQQVAEVPELHLVALQLKHESTGSDYLHIARDDANNVFSVAFRTPPPNDKGICHILEHLALCGSHRFPCRDPFFKMLNRSLSTFMNAFTGSDYTMYLYSSQNMNDYNNLMKVYLDAAFFPRLRNIDFRQEGWRLEHEKIEDKNSPLVLKGIVFNEMKGCFSSSVQLYVEKLQNSLMPSHVYRNISGGHPLHIPNLSWHELKGYHDTYYHPSNARFFSYGTFPMEDHLTHVNNYVLSKFSRVNLDTSIMEEVRWTEPRNVTITCASDPMAANPEKQTTLSVSYLLEDVSNTYETFALYILCNLLVDGASAPFYKALLQSGIGADYSPGTGYNGQTKTSYFSVGLCGIHRDDSLKVTDIINKTIDKVIEEGFPKERIDAVLHQEELGNKNQLANFGLALNLAINPVWNHSADAINVLQINKHINWFCQQLEKNPRFLQEKLEHYFKKNNHRLTLVMVPDEGFNHQQVLEERNLLDQKVNGLSDDDKETIFREGLEMANIQREKEDISCLPCLSISEVNPNIQETIIEKTLEEGVPVFSTRQFTNGITYFRAVINASQVPMELQPVLPLFCNVITKLGAGARDYMQQDQEISFRTGGLNASMHVVDNPNGNNEFEYNILLSSYCLTRNILPMLSLWTDIFNGTHFENEERLNQLILMEASELVQGLSHSGHSYAMRRACSLLNETGSLREKFSGLTYVSLLKQMAELTNLKETAEKLKAIGKIVLNKDTMRCWVTTTPKTTRESIDCVSGFLSTLHGTPHDRDKYYRQSSFEPKQQRTHFILPFSVNFLSQGFLTVPYSHPDFARLRIATKLLTLKYLHREIRERGGAYGGGVTLLPGGVMSFYSYRDPNVSETLKAFTDSVQWLLDGNFNEQDLLEAKLGAFAEVDQPVAPGDRGLYWFLNGVSDEGRQMHKNWLFATEKQELQDVIKKYLIDNPVSGVTVLGPENKQIAEDTTWTVEKE